MVGQRKSKPQNLFAQTIPPGRGRGRGWEDQGRVPCLLGGAVHNQSAYLGGREKGKVPQSHGAEQGRFKRTGGEVGMEKNE